MSKYIWGDNETQYFHELTPEKILEAVELLGTRATGRCLALNSVENRVYEIEIETERSAVLASPSDAFRVAKFYRPGRWSEQQILEEHAFQLELQENDIPVIAPIVYQGRSLFTLPGTNIHFAVYPKQGGRIPYELDQEQIEQLGRLIGRVHRVGQSKKAPHRLNLNEDTFGRQNLQYLIDQNFIPSELTSEFQKVIGKICDFSAPIFREVKSQRIHGDCHLGNILWRDKAYLVDFDDMLNGPTVQDMWTLIPERDEKALVQRIWFLNAYETMNEFDDRELHLIEPLRALRMLHFSAWMAKRWNDLAFKQLFPTFNGPAYWNHLLADLKDQATLIER